MLQPGGAQMLQPGCEGRGVQMPQLMWCVYVCVCMCVDGSLMPQLGCEGDQDAAGAGLSVWASVRAFIMHAFMRRFCAMQFRGVQWLQL